MKSVIRSATLALAVLVVPILAYPQFPTPTGSFGSPVPPGPSPTGCSDFEILVARGTGEPGPFGAIVGDPLVSAVTQAIPGSRGYAVQYPADTSSNSPFIGAADVVQRLQAQSQACPSQKFALVGYSQGADVMHSACANIAVNIQNKILALVMFGDPQLRTNFPGVLQSKLFENCATGDPVCSSSGSGDFSAHVSYNNPGTPFQQNSAQFIEAAFRGTPEPSTTLTG